jgi:hypothetical protein
MEKIKAEFPDLYTSQEGPYDYDAVYDFLKWIQDVSGGNRYTQS